MREKTFEHKGQMINYYQKLKCNPKIKYCVMMMDATKGYLIQWYYQAATLLKALQSDT